MFIDIVVYYLRMKETQNNNNYSFDLIGIAESRISLDRNNFHFEVMNFDVF